MSSPSHNTSASQVETYLKCPRLWYDGSVLGNKSPPSPAQSFGTVVHKVLEDYLDTNGPIKIAGSGLDPRLPKILAAAIPYLPDPVRDAGTYKSEGGILIPTFAGGPLWKGYIDLWMPGGPPRAPTIGGVGGGPNVRDYKTTSDFRYAKTPQELERNIQLVSYAWWAMTTPEYPAPVVTVGHLYLKTRPAHKAHLVETDPLPYDYVRGFWQNEILPHVAAMEAIRAAMPKVDDVYPGGVDTGHCNAYGGCPRKSACGIGSNTVVQIRPNPNTKANPTMSMTLMEKLKLMQANGGKLPEPVAVETPVAAPAAVAQVEAVGVVPPDAPPREQPAETIVPPAAVAAPDLLPGEKVDLPPAAPKKRGRPPKAKPADLPKTAAELGRKAVGGPAALCPACNKYVGLDSEERFLDHKGVNDDLLADDMVACVTSGDTGEEAFATVQRMKDLKASIAASAAAKEAADEADRSSPAGTITPGVVAAAPAPAAAPVPANDNGIDTIYIDCLPTKGAHKGLFTLVEDWLAPIAQAAAEANNVEDYRFISYTSKAVLANAISKTRQLGMVPPVLVVSSYAPGSDVVLESLVPFARTVVRALRG